MTAARPVGHSHTWRERAGSSRSRDGGENRPLHSHVWLGRCRVGSELLPPRPRDSPLSIVSLLARRLAFWMGAAACGLVAAQLLARPGRVPPPVLHEESFRLTEHERDPLRVTVARPLLLPYCYGDCDLLATIAVPAEGEIDLVLRKVDLAGGHGRFSLLRLSATQEAWPWRTREEALFGDPVLGGPAPGGVRVAPGLPASIRLELRGRLARANVAGRWLPALPTTDAAGAFAFVVRDGVAEVSHLQILPLPRADANGWLWGAGGLLGLAIGVLARRRRSAMRVVLALAAFPICTALLHMLLAEGAVVGARFSTPALAVLLLTSALAVNWGLGTGSLRATLLRWSAAVLVAMVGIETFCRLERTRLVALEDPRLDLYFGVDSQQAPFDALAKLLHGKNEVHTADPDIGAQIEPGGPSLARIVFLGGEMMMEANLDRAQHLAIQTTASLAQRTGVRYVAAVVSTTYPHTLQQTLLFERFYADAYPAACVVLGVDRWDAQREGSASARRRLERVATNGVAVPFSFAWAVLADASGDARIATPDELGVTIDEFARACAQRRLPLLLATHAAISAPYLVAVDAAARRHGLRVVHDVVRTDESADSDKLAQALVELLGR